MMTKHRGLRWTLFPALAVTLGVGVSLPAAAQDHPWEDASLPPEQRATLLLEAMTLEEKIQQIGIYDDIDDPDLEECVEESTLRTVVGIERLDMPTIRMTNAGTGIRGGSCQNPSATGMPSSTTAAATFDPELNYEYGEVLGEETRAYAHQVLLGPAMNLVRHPYGGRNHEYFSEDPYLSGAMAVQQVRGVQSQGVNAQISTSSAASRRRSGGPPRRPSPTARCTSCTSSPARWRSRTATPPRSCAPSPTSTGTGPARTSSCCATPSTSGGASTAGS